MLWLACKSRADDVCCMPQALSNTAWACSKLGVYSKEFLEAIAQEAIKKLSRFNAQNIANLVSLGLSSICHFVLAKEARYMSVVMVWKMTQSLLRPCSQPGMLQELLRAFASLRALKAHACSCHIIGMQGVSETRYTTVSKLKSASCL